MKKFFNCIFAAILIMLLITIYIRSNNEPILFEITKTNFSSGKTENVLTCDTYYALKKDGILVWAYGQGYLGNGTSGTFFNRVDEKGYIKLSNDEVNALKALCKKIPHKFNKTTSDHYAQTSTKDGIDYILLYNGSHYSIEDPKTENYEDNLLFFELEKAMQDIVTAKKLLYEDKTQYIYNTYDCTIYDFVAFANDNDN